MQPKREKRKRETSFIFFQDKSDFPKEKHERREGMTRLATLDLLTSSLQAKILENQLLEN